MDLAGIIEKAQFAIHHIDDVEARKTIKKIDDFFAAGNIKTDQQLIQQLNDIRLKLMIVNLPNLSENDAIDILKKHYLDSYEIGIPMENRLTALLFFYPDIPRDELRKKLKIALLQNEQKIGGLTVGQWIKEFENKHDIKTRDLSASVRFIIEHEAAIRLSPVDREKLKELLHTYDYLLVSTLPATGPLLKQILEANIFKNQDGYNQNDNDHGINDKFTEKNYHIFDDPNIATGGDKLVRLSFDLILQQYPDVSKQLISSTPLKLRISPEPVRPSVKNWITDYHEQMGLGKHGTFDRGNYLFHSENAKRLTAAERQRVSAVLASLDEGTPLAVDPEKQQIIFNEQRTTNNEQQATNDKKLTTDNLQQTTFHVQNAESNRQFTPLNPRSNEVRSNLTGQATDNRQNTINNRQDTPYKMSQTTDSQKYEMENRQPKTINLRPEAGAASQMRQDTRPAAPVVNVQQRTMSQPQKPVTARPQVPHASFQGARPAAPPFNLPQEKTENLSQYFGARPNSGQRDVQLQRNVQSPAPKKEFENKSPNFSDLLRTQQDSNSPKAPAGPTQAAAPAGGTVSFSSPQQLTVERDAPVKRSPYRITPHDDIQQ